MKNRIIGVPFVALLLLLGAGCQNQNAPSPTLSVQTSVGTIETPSSTIPVTSSTSPIAVSSTLPVVIQTDWQTANLFSGWTLKHPNKADALDPTSDEVTKEQLLLRVDLGTAVKDPGGKSVPTRKLEVYRLKFGDLRLDGCDSALVGKQGIRQVMPVATALNAILCLQKSSDAGAGNLYDTYDYIFATNTGAYVFSFTTHSVQCQNFERPDEQCVMYDEKRDAELFPIIMGTLAR